MKVTSLSSVLFERKVAPISNRELLNGLRRELERVTLRVTSVGVGAGRQGGGDSTPRRTKFNPDEVHRLLDMLLPNLENLEGMSVLSLMFGEYSNQTFVHLNASILISNAFNRQLRASIATWLSTELKRFVEHRGWFVLTRETDGMITLAPNYTSPVSMEALPKILYHVTPNSSLEKVLRSGIKPSVGIPHGTNAVRSYPQRVYLMTNKSSSGRLANQFAGVGHRGEHALLAVDTSKLRHGTHFFIDNEIPYGDGVWTYSHVPPEALKFLQNI